MSWGGFAFPAGLPESCSQVRVWALAGMMGQSGISSGCVSSEYGFLVASVTRDVSRLGLLIVPIFSNRLIVMLGC